MGGAYAHQGKRGLMGCLWRPSSTGIRAADTELSLLSGTDRLILTQFYEEGAITVSFSHMKNPRLGENYVTFPK